MMRMPFLRSFVLLSGVAAPMLCLLDPATARAQAQTDYSKVEMKTTKLADNFYTLASFDGAVPPPGSKLFPSGASPRNRPERYRRY